MNRAVHFVVPYSAVNSSVRTRVVRWGERLADGPNPMADAVFSVHGPGFIDAPPPAGVPTVVLRNVGRFSRGGRERRLLSAASSGVYELDDGLPFDDGRLPGLGRIWKRPWKRSLIARRAGGAADRIIAGNEILATWAAEQCADVRLVPTCVEPDDYVPKTDYSVSERPVIGWIGSRATEPYLLAIAPVLAALHERLGAVVEVVSSPGQVPVAMRPFSTRTAWTESITHDRLARWDVGIMPLHDGIYERAKCGYKLLQYAAAGLPAVGSPVGVNASMLSDMDALAASTNDEWYDALLELLTESDDRRQARAVRGRGVAVAYSYDAWEASWRSAVGLT